MEKAIRLAARLGARIIQIAGYDVYYETSTPATVENFARNLRLSVEMAARWGINIVMYAMCLDYKADQVHIPFILKRRQWQVRP